MVVRSFQFLFLYFYFAKAPVFRFFRASRSAGAELRERRTMVISSLSYVWGMALLLLPFTDYFLQST
nr:MAG TPA: hypothetical protein [Caudoviricetes sp.]